MLSNFKTNHRAQTCKYTPYDQSKNAPQIWFLKDNIVPENLVWNDLIFQINVIVQQFPLEAKRQQV